MKTVSTQKAPAAIGPYSQAITHSGLVFTSGQIPLSPITGEVVGLTIEEQTEQLIANLKEVLLAAGSSIERVIKTTCFITDISNFAAFNAVYAKHFTSKPARSCVEVSALPKGVLAEIEAVAELAE
ncbi:MAG: RidA family protein [Oscillospiraceae bacterium]|jgi:2-iminobutanoate/2-iminopropanoate deaminase|nr:RidA family protein [Oscillospiraceae bacterium]